MNEAVFKWKHCESKQKYNNAKGAESRMKLKRKRGIIVSPYNIYLCKYCGKYHIGHKKIIDMKEIK